MLLQTCLEIRVVYASAAQDCRRVLRVLPLYRAAQKIGREKWKVTPDADFEGEKRDAYGNRRLMFHHARIPNTLQFALEIEAETTAEATLEFAPDAARWKMPSRAVDITAELQKIAREARELTALQRAAHFAQFCSQNLQYEARANDQPLPSNQVWARRRGNCADFTHLFLALCRASGLLARYVAGYSRSQGQMHAWAEVWEGSYWHAFDPTFDMVRPVYHLAAAVGRDFYDCAPHTGQFRGAGEAQIEVWCQTRRLDSA